MPANNARHLFFDRAQEIPEKVAAWKSVGVSIFCILAAYLIQSVFWSFIPASPFLLFYPAIFLAAWAGGTRSGILTTALAVIVTDYAFLPPYGRFAFNSI